MPEQSINHHAQRIIPKDILQNIWRRFYEFAHQKYDHCKFKMVFNEFLQNFRKVKWSYLQMAIFMTDTTLTPVAGLVKTIDEIQKIGIIQK